MSPSLCRVAQHDRPLLPAVLIWVSGNAGRRPVLMQVKARDGTGRKNARFGLAQSPSHGPEFQELPQ
jgi:hypothetical protein